MGNKRIPSYMPELELEEVAKVKDELERENKGALEFVGGNFKMNPKLWVAYLAEADKLIVRAKKDGIDLHETYEWGKSRTDINKDGTVSREELAAVLFARSSRLRAKLDQQGQLVVAVDPHLYAIRTEEGKMVHFGAWPDRALEIQSQGPFQTADFEKNSKFFHTAAAKEAALLDSIAKQAYGQNVTGSMIDTGDVAKKQLLEIAHAANREAYLERDR